MQASQTKLKAILPSNHITTIIKNQALHALQTKIKTMATIKQNTIHPTTQTLQAKLNNSTYKNKLIKKQQKESSLQELQRNLKQIHPDNH